MSRADRVEAEDDELEEAVPLERRALPAALRQALFDLYHHSVRLVPANVLWGAVLIGLGWLAILAGVWLAFVGLPLLGLPLVGIYRMAGHIARGQEVVLSDVVAAARDQFMPSLAVAAAISWGLLLLGFNVIAGINWATPFGWLVATLSGWAFVALTIGAVVVWPLLADPDRRHLPARERVRLAGYVVLAAPLRMVALTVAAVVLGVASTIAFAAIVTISVAFIACVSCRTVLPDADRLAERLAARRPAG